MIRSIGLIPKRVTTTHLTPHGGYPGTAQDLKNEIDGIDITGAYPIEYLSIPKYLVHGEGSHTLSNLFMHDLEEKNLQVQESLVYRMQFLITVPPVTALSATLNFLLYKDGNLQTLTQEEFILTTGVSGYHVEASFYCGAIDSSTNEKHLVSLLHLRRENLDSGFSGSEACSRHGEITVPADLGRFIVRLNVTNPDLEQISTVHWNRVLYRRKFVGEDS